MPNSFHPKQPHRPGLEGGANETQPIRRAISAYLETFEWVPAQNHPIYARILEEISSRIEAELDLVNRKQDALDETSSAAIHEKVDSRLFMTPTAVRWIYSQHTPAAIQAFIQKGVDYHCYFIRRAVRAVVRRFTGSFRRLDMSQDEVEDELWGTTMEDIVRILTDSSARLWQKEETHPRLFPPETQRGYRRGAVVRLALSPSGELLALYHTDAMLTLWRTTGVPALHTWNLLSVLEDAGTPPPPATPDSLFFSMDERSLCLEWSERRLVKLSISEPETAIVSLPGTEVERFIREIGAPYLPERGGLNLGGFSFKPMTPEPKPQEYLESVYDWSVGADGRLIATASERERSVPEWMMEIGFEKAVYLIIKRRLIDMIRKRTHTGYACWRCGWTIAASNATECPNCGADFTRCPIGCPIPPSEPLDSTNAWTCPHCGCPSRILEPKGNLQADDLYGDVSYREHEWKREHDLERIKSVLKDVTVTYRKRQISCNQVLDLKAQGLTNEEIGQQLDVPRGSVDYLWNQCRQEILHHFGED